MKHIVTTIALTILASSAFSQSVLKDELKSLKDKKEAAYQQAEQVKLDQLANVNKKYYEVLKQLLLKAKVSNAKDNELIWGIKRELADLGHFEPEDWCYGTWIVGPRPEDPHTVFKLDFDGAVYRVNRDTGKAFEDIGSSKLEILSDAKVKFKSYRIVYEVQKISTGKAKFSLFTEQGKTSEMPAVRQ